MADNLSMKRDQVIGIVKGEGPLIPAVIARKLEIDLTFASAMLGEMVDSKNLKITHVKYGGSPFYYVEGQEGKLKDLIKHLNEKDLETANLLMEKRVLRDRDLSPLQRVSLREIKDYAKSVKVTANGQEDLFWRWYLLSEGEVKGLIGEYLKENQVEEKKEEVVEREEPRPIQAEPAREIKQEVQQETRLEVGREVKQEVVEELPKVESQTNLVGEEEGRDLLGSFFVENEIEVMQQEIIKKNKEINYVVGLDTRIGKSLFFLKYKDKKKVNEADLSLAMHESGTLPLIFVSTGDISNKAKTMLGKEFRGVIFKKI